FFFRDLHGVLGRVGSVLKPGGTAAFAFSRETDPRWTWYEDLLQARGVLEAAPPVRPQPRTRNRGVLVEALQQAGFKDAREIVEPTELHYASPQAWWDSLWTHGTRRPLEHLTTDKLESLKAECLAIAERQMTPDGLPIRWSLIYILAAWAKP